MGNFILIALIAAALLGGLMVVFAVGRTLQRSEIGRSKAMRERGIRCTAEWMRSLESECSSRREDGLCQPCACGDCGLMESCEAKNKIE